VPLSRFKAGVRARAGPNGYRVGAAGSYLTADLLTGSRTSPSIAPPNPSGAPC
jgi:hypothetical protein